MLADGSRTSTLVASTKLEKERANAMTMKERLKIHREMEKRNRERIRALKERKSA